MPGVDQTRKTADFGQLFLNAVAGETDRDFLVQSELYSGLRCWPCQKSGTYEKSPLERVYKSDQ